jgi:hypothetical protein
MKCCQCFITPKQNCSRAGILCDLATHINPDVCSFTADTNYCCCKQSSTDIALLGALSFDDGLPPQNKGS